VWAERVITDCQIQLEVRLLDFVVPRYAGHYRTSCSVMARVEDSQPPWYRKSAGTKMLLRGEKVRCYVMKFCEI
jgi:hypothetical protein